MTQTFDLNKMGLAPMDEVEMQGVDGGGFWGKVADYLLGKLVDLAIEGFLSGKANNIGPGGSAGVPGGGGGHMF